MNGTTAGKLGQRLRWPVVALAVAVLWVVPGARVPAAPPSEVVVVTAAGEAQDEVIAGLRAVLDRAGSPPVSLKALTTAGALVLLREQRKSPALVVTLGTEPARTVLQARPSVPVVCAFLPQSAYATLVAGEPAHSPVTALYLDQPFARQFRLIRLALSAAVRVGVVLGPESRRYAAVLREAAGRNRLQLKIETISESRQLIGALHRVLEDSDILLAVPDPQVFNRQSLPNVLITAYRQGKPVAGYSRASVSAGALLAAFSTPAQIGRQLGEMLAAHLLHRESGLPSPMYPRYVSVEVNRHVAHSLGLILPRTEQLERELAKPPETSP